MNKISIGKKPYVYPMPMGLVGSMVEKKPNFMPVAWLMPVNYNPPMVGIALGKIHYTNQGIKEAKAFSVNIPNKGLLKPTDYCGLVSGKTEDKSNIFNVFYDQFDNIPMIRECPLCIQCQLHQVIDLPSNELFIGEVLNTFVDENCLTDGKPDIAKLSPFTLTMPDNQFWQVGDNLGEAWSIGREFK